MRQTVSLSELGKWVGGGTPSKANSAYWTDGTIPWVSPKDMKTERIRDAMDRITEEAADNSAATRISRGAVLVVVRSGILKHSLPVAVADVDITINQDMKAVELRPGFLPEYVAWAIRAHAKDILHRCTKSGTTVQNIDFPSFLRFKVPIVPLDEQRRIVAEIEERLSRLEAGVAALKRVQANLKRYRAAALAEMTHIDKEQLPTGWHWSSVGELAQVGTGSTPKRDRADYWQGGTVPWVTSGVVNQPTVTEPTEFITETALRETNCKVYPPGTLLVAMYGEGKTRGMCTELCVPAATNQALAAVQTSVELRPFLKRVLQASYERTRSAASGGVQPNLNLSHVRAIRVPLPPPDEQDRIVQEIDRRLSVVEELETQVGADLARAGPLRQAALAQAFAPDSRSR